MDISIRITASFAPPVMVMSELRQTEEKNESTMQRSTEAHT